MEPIKRKVEPWIFVAINDSCNDLINHVRSIGLIVREQVPVHTAYRRMWRVECASGKYSFFVQFPGLPHAFVNELDLPRWASLCEVAAKRDQARREAQAITRSKLRVV